MTSNYSFRWDKRAEKQLGKLDAAARGRIVRYMHEVVHGGPNPKDRGKALGDDLKGYWRYRVGAYRVICAIDDFKVEVVGLGVFHRSRGYKGLPLS